MPINFLDAACKTESARNNFGLCDNPPPAEDPAYIDELDPSIWIAEVNNPNGVLIDFFAVDHCVNVYRGNGEMAKRCDGILEYDNKLAFVELKDRGSKGWISAARKQLTETFLFFDANHTLGAYTKVDAYVCNKQRPLAVVNSASEVQKFKDDTGLILTIDRNISIE